MVWVNYKRKSRVWKSDKIHKSRIFFVLFFSASENQDQKPFGRVEGVAGSHLVLGGAWKVVGEGSERWVTVLRRLFGFSGKKSVEFSDFPKEKLGPRRTKKFLTDLFYP